MKTQMMVLEQRDLLLVGLSPLQLQPRAALSLLFPMATTMK